MSTTAKRDWLDAAPLSANGHTYAKLSCPLFSLLMNGVAYVLGVFSKLLQHVMVVENEGKKATLPISIHWAVLLQVL